MREYFGEMNELRAGARGKIPLKPAALQSWESFKRWNIPLVQGGLLDQPYMMMLEMETAAEEMEIMTVIQEIANRPAKG